ncbi:MAG: chromosome segregation protein SMC [Proteobacteria bacterium]|nr:MAG: chromosome segregation protein SMC [Pseudomonadota bacterium]
MRLKSIRLAGFKSFVDPTNVPFPSNLSAVVGPNGCGKSNIIDAVRWVMGESSAKHLRGESMADVIFNGSTSRKPVGQASIELVFDNTEDKLLGEYARFNEISIKRRVTRDGGSDYFLNGTKCRRRDITDIFLGTGLGPRSYAIIEQGMISRLIESKPEELRVYIEEAAGISKYKERRKETESRIRRTRENLERLSDITEELDRQLAHLQKQAKTAEKYTELKKEERDKKAQLGALRWLDLDRQLEASGIKVRDAEIELEKHLSERIKNDSVIDQIKLDYTDRADEYETAQTSYYETGSAISRLEQSIRHQQEKIANIARDKKENARLADEVREELDTEKERLMVYEEELEEIEPAFEEALFASEESADQLADAEENLHQWQKNWDDFNHRSADVKNRAELEQSRIRQLEQQISDNEKRKQKIGCERQEIAQQLDLTSLDTLTEQAADIEERIARLSEQKQSGEEQVNRIEEAIAEKNRSVNEDRSRLQVMQGKLGSLETLQEAALGLENDNVLGELRRLNLDDSVLVARQVTTAQGWEKAAEAVLSPYMTSALVEFPDSLIDGFLEGTADRSQPSETRRLSFIDKAHGGARFPLNQDVLALDHVQAMKEMVTVPESVETIVSGVYLVDSVKTALASASLLKAGEQFACKDGTLIGPNWVRFFDDNHPESGAFARQKEIESLQSRINSLKTGCQRQDEEIEKQVKRLALLVETDKTLSLELSEATQTKHELGSNAEVVRTRNEQIEQRIRRFDLDLEELEESHAEQSEQLSLCRDSWQEAMDSALQYADERELLLGQRDQIRGRFDELRQLTRHQKDAAHQLQLRLQAVRSKQETAQANCQRLSTQLARVQEKLRELELMDEQSADPVDSMRMELEALLDQKISDETALSRARSAKQELDAALGKSERERLAIEQKVQDSRAVIQSLRMEMQAFEIRKNGYRDELAESGSDVKTLSDALSPDASQQELEAEIEKLGTRIQRLGAINLAAIEEYQAQSERKAYLDEQSNDLVEALEMLENAIRKIDRETRAKFKETFDTVNGGLQDLFPKVFGGGSACLELTADDLLETGVAIMARPPGKKNSTIHLLSGGEKALTAIALVFSIFQLNPAPFCMLDEVDAPLDDANVGRYANLVREMSAQVQFIYITHNKIAMEMADQLMGVTMHEPGVSRLVSVDVEEAVALAIA